MNTDTDIPKRKWPVKRTIALSIIGVLLLAAFLVYKNFKISFSYWREPRCRIRLRNQFYIDYNTPDVAPIPATINSISPLDTIPIPTFMTSSLYLRKNN